MTRRNGSVIKYIVFIVLFLGVVYFIYMHNKVNEKLKDTERTAERYRREQESCSSQLQESLIQLLVQKKSFLLFQTQNDDLQAEYSKLNLDLQKDKEEQKQVESQRNQEYMQLKQEKELELTSLKDQLANLGREKQQLADEVNSLRTQLQNAQVKMNNELPHPKSPQ
ncbi:hypothetical protein FSP39_023523 [Pinctada imbricata]|uniref:Uncharacterized protein n=1 Tax=Pinctada imbricata TaxID=66713 RepID=A0AA88YQ75_PINIB|nr:hypothetical protein FSP39_023523 [Pinctada imbricata]